MKIIYFKSQQIDNNTPLYNTKLGDGGKVDTKRERLMKIVQRIPLYDKNFPYIFFWSHKSGSSMLIRWFFFQIGLIDKSSHKLVQERAKFYFDEMIDQILENRKPVIKLVRNPYTRVVSSFLAFVEQALIHKTNKNLVREWHKAKRYIDIEDGISFKQFLYFLKINGVELGHIEGHIAQQYLKGEEEFIDKYIKIENFNKEISLIEEKNKLLKSKDYLTNNLSHYHSNIMKDSHNFSEKKITKKLLEDLWSSKRIPTYSNFYDKETLDLVQYIFNKDINNYNYTFPWVSCKFL